MTGARDAASAARPSSPVTGPGDGDGYAGPMTLRLRDTCIEVRGMLRGHFEPIDGRYHWHGRLDSDPTLSAAMTAGRTQAMLSTPHATAPCEVADPDSWQRYRVSGVGAPPFPSDLRHDPQQLPPPSADPEAAAPGSDDLPAHVTVAVIGAGFGGIGVGIRLRQAGITDFVILERASAVGGTWRDNAYPGCACDVPSHLYSYSFAPNPDWSRSFSRQPEIWQYLEQITGQYRLHGHLRLRTELMRAEWNPAAAHWQLTTSRGMLTASIVIAAAGPLSEPSLPDIPGLDSFPGPVFHSARWDKNANLAGQRVAVVGTGASAIQIVPELQPHVASLTLFQRTPAWVLPRRDRRITAAERWLFRRVPLAQRLARLGIYLSREAAVGAFTRRPALLRAAQRVAARHLARAITDPRLRTMLTPGYVMGCKRILLSSDFYPALTQPNVSVIGSALAKVDGTMLTAADGSSAEVDAIVFATGFRVTDMPLAERIISGKATSLADSWSDGMAALRGTTVAGFPGLCLVVGPNTGLGHNSMIYMIESQLRYIEDYVKTSLQLDGPAALDVCTDAQRRWNDRLQQRMTRTVWSTGGCRSWYLTPSGCNPTLWPASTLAFRRATRRVDHSEYEVITGTER